MGLTSAVDLEALALRTVRRWWRAWVENDVETLTRMATAECVERTDTGSLRPIGPDAVSSSHQGSHVHVTEWDIHEPAVRVFTDTMVCSYSFRLSGVRCGRTVSIEGYAVDTLVRRGDDWVYASHQGSVLADRTHPE